MEEFRDRRREVWYDETLVPWSTAARVALEATGADPELVQAWLDTLTPEDCDWMSYGQWVEAEVVDLANRSRSVRMSPADWSQHFKWTERVWFELAKLTEEQYHREGGKTCL